MNFNISQRTTLKIEVTSNEENNINQSTTLRAEISSTDQYFNISQILTTTAFSNEKDFNIQSIIYIVTSVRGIWLTFLIIILMLCLRKRVQDPKNLTDDGQITRTTKHRKDDTTFKGKNELYQSADDVLDLDRKATKGFFCSTIFQRGNQNTSESGS